MKKFRSRAQTSACDSLWDPDTERFTDDFDDMVGIIKRAALTRQGHDRSDPTAGEGLLQSWNVDLSQCRTQLHTMEIVEIILGCGSNKKPGPDGIPAEFFKAHAKLLAPLFSEGWDELLQTLTPRRILSAVESGWSFRRTRACAQLKNCVTWNFTTSREKSSPACAT